MNMALLATSFDAGFLLGLFFDPEVGGFFPPKRRLNFNGLHGVISQKTVLFRLLFLCFSSAKDHAFTTFFLFLPFIYWFL
jgi:hypothetical protein